ncbi:MAG TPA: peptidoglycan DD-metalloendopeptidase family protein [Acidimicrobiia bacterium]|nr:peptidoglycan DD-metalloendopeptidase family protein [Acidimicrobiia bacterium]
MGRPTPKLPALALAVVIGLLAGPVAAGAQAADPPELAAARGGLAAARSRAQQAAEEYRAVQQELQKITREVELVQRQIPMLMTAINQMRVRLQARAAEAYRGASMRSAVAFELFEVENLLDGVRVTRLAEAANARTDEIADGVGDLTAQLAEKEEQLARQQAEQADLVAAAERRAAELDRALAEAARHLRTVEHDVAVRAYEEALAAAAAQPGTTGTTIAPPEEVSHRPPPADPSLAALVPVDELLCPIDAPVTFFNDWGQPRSNWRVHEGTDIFAGLGTPNVAVADGVVKRRLGGLGGNSVWLEADHGVDYYYAHFDRFEGAFDGPESSRRVKKGDVIGYTGNTGNASGGPVHTHFEVHPGGGGAINPYRILLVTCATQLGN